MAVLLLALGACTKDDKRGGDSRLLEISTADTIGRLQLQAEGGSAAAYGSFYSAWSQEQTLYFGAFDECFPVPAMTGTGAGISVGPEITITYGTSVLIVSEIGNGYYDGYASGVFPPEVDYVIDIPGAGGVDGVQFELFAPGAVTAAPLPAIVPGEPLEVEFNQGSGADWIRIAVSDSAGGNAHLCHSEDDGSFTVPGEITALMGSTGLVDVGPRTFATAEMGGKLVVATATR